MLKAQPSQPHSGLSNRIEPGARISIPPIIAEATRITLPNI